MKQMMLLSGALWSHSMEATVSINCGENELTYFHSGVKRTWNKYSRDIVLAITKSSRETLERMR